MAKRPQVSLWKEQGKVFSESVVGSDCVQAVDGFGVLAIQGFCCLRIIIRSIQWENIHIESDDARTFFLLDESGLPD